MTLRVRLLADSADGWTEGTGGVNTRATGPMTWNNHPNGSGRVCSSAVPAFGAGVTSIDVTPC